MKRAVNYFFILHSPHMAMEKSYFDQPLLFSSGDEFAENNIQVEQVPWYDNRLSVKSKQLENISVTWRHVGCERTSSWRHLSDKETECVRIVLNYNDFSCLGDSLSEKFNLFGILNFILTVNQKHLHHRSKKWNLNSVFVVAVENFRFIELSMWVFPKVEWVYCNFNQYSTVLQFVNKRNIYVRLVIKKPCH